MKHNGLHTGKATLPFPKGFDYLAEYYSRKQQEVLLAEFRLLLASAPLYQQRMPQTGAPLSVLMSNAGKFGWVTDREDGYRYQETHPVILEPWPSIPESLLMLWQAVTKHPDPPNLCLVNYYNGDARLGLHQDRGETSLGAPVLSVSLGDDATFVVGGLSRKDKTRRVLLRSGDVIAFGGPSRLIFHGVQNIRLHSSDLLSEGGRFNLTLRRLNRS